jgi:hypothetical protein
VSISDAAIDQEGNVPLQISIRAQFGSRSVCLVRGLTNRSVWHDYPETEKMRAAAISITPKVVCGLIRLAQRDGWDPGASNSNFELSADLDVIRALGADEPSPLNRADR